MLDLLTSILHTIFIIFFALWFWQIYKIQNLGFVFFISLIAKISAGILLGLIYYHHYKMGDTISYFDKSIYISDTFWNDPLKYAKVVFLNEYDPDFLAAMGNEAINIPRTIFFAKILSVLNLFTQNNYWLNSIYLSLFCFAGSWKIFYTLFKSYLQNKTSIAISFLFVPSVVFWSSGVLKESIVMGALYFSLALVLELSDRGFSKNYFKLFLLLLNLWLIYSLKYYVFAIVIPLGVSCYLSFVLFRECNLGLKFVVYCLAFGTLVWVVSHIYYTLSFENIIHEIIVYHDDMWVYSINETQKEHLNIFHYSKFTENIPVIISKIPVAIFYGLFLPLPNNVYHIFQWFTAIENLVLFLLTGWSISIYIQKPTFDLLKTNLLIYILICACVFGLTTPNWGTMARYKVVYLPFFVFLITSNLLYKQTKKD